MEFNTPIKEYQVAQALLFTKYRSILIIPDYIAVVDNEVVGWYDISFSNKQMHPHTGTLGISVLKSYRSKTVRKALLQAALIRRRLKIEGIHKKQ